MKNLVYDIVVGAILLIGLMSIVPIMNANRNYIAQSAITKDSTERFVESDGENFGAKIKYNIFDVHAFVIQHLVDNNLLQDGIIIRFEEESGVKFETSGGSEDVEKLLKRINEKMKSFNSTDPEEYAITKEIDGGGYGALLGYDVTYVIKKVPKRGS